MDLWHRRRQFSSLNGLLLRHPLLMMGCFLTPAVVAVVNLRAAVALTIMIAVVCVPTYVVMNLVGGRLTPLWRVVCAPLLASVFFIPAWYITGACFPEMAERLGFYLPILVMDIFFTSRCSVLAPRVKLQWVLLDVVSCCLAIGSAFCVIGVLREYLGNGTIWNITVHYHETVPAALLPFAGFMIVAFLAAGAQLMSRWIRRGLAASYQYRKLKKEAEHE